MANPNRRAGTIFLKRGGKQLDLQGNPTYGLGTPKRDPVIGPDRAQGYTETQQVAFIECEITDRADLDLRELFLMDGETVTLELANGKTFVLHDAWQAGEGTVNTERATVSVRFEAAFGEEII